MNKEAKAAVCRCSAKKMFLKISQNSQKSTCARAPFFNKDEGLSLQLY